MNVTEINVLLHKLEQVEGVINMGCECDECGGSIVLEMPDAEDVVREARMLIRSLTGCAG